MSNLIDIAMSLNLVVAISVVIVIALRSTFYHRLTPASRYLLWLTLPISCALYLVIPEQNGPSIFTVTALGDAVSHTASLARQNESISVLFIAYLLVAVAYVLTEVILLSVTYFRSSEHSYDVADEFFQQPIKLLKTKNNVGPAVFGLFRPAILLPDNFFETHSREEMLLIFKHELVHWQRKDSWLNIIALAVCALCWCNPVIWIAYRLYRRDQELSCDALVCGNFNGEQKASYARLLLKQSSGRNLALMANWAQPKLIKERIMNIKNLRSSALNKLVTLITCGLVALSVNAVSQSGDTEELKPVSVVHPQYPKDAAKKKIEGFVQFAFDLDSNGTPVDITVVASEPSEVFDKYATAAISQWRFNQSNVKNAKYTVEFKVQ